MRLALDTNRYVDLARGDDSLEAQLERAEAIFIPFVVMAELRAGFAVGKHGRENEATLRRFLLKPDVEILYPDDATTLAYASVYRQLRAQGTPIPTNDLWIAALAHQHDLALCSRDEHFRHVPQLTLA
jgi:tRNA(fMet)-specific endonuclease VapC